MDTGALQCAGTPDGSRDGAGGVSEQLGFAWGRVRGCVQFLVTPASKHDFAKNITFKRAAFRFSNPSYVLNKATFGQVFVATRTGTPRVRADTSAANPLASAALPALR